MFTLYEDPQRGIKTVGWFQDDGKIHVQVRQYIPDSFFDHLKMMRELGDNGHYRCVGVLPSALQEKLLVDGNGRPLDMRDPDREKKKKQIFNDIDYRKLRVWEGRV